ncbi:RNA polymerase sigma factor [Actinoplanes sp. L3-i22]|uniref:RNA polymerase sigma factor n=1 Tax=Actinoplanes sp. L3-i22 TaxID=2836373 RepID=UPI001C849B99|nr:sigma-70 family RNA polymerase sigma factor [Actinoplanes sp. L3-i22]
MAVVETDDPDESSLRSDQARARPDRRETERWYRELAPRVVARLCRSGADQSAAEDATSEAVSRALARWDELDDPAAWVFTAAPFILIDHKVQAGRATLYADLPATDASSVDCAVLVAGEQRRQWLLQALTPGQRRAMELAMDGYPMTEIATEMGRSPDAVRQLIARALAALRTRAASEGAGLPHQRRVTPPMVTAAEEASDE